MKLYVTGRTTQSPRLDETLKRKRLPALNGLRAVVVLPVIINHFGYAAPAGLSVTMFFVLSGFLITWLLLKEFEQTQSISIPSFYLRRTLRIFPAYYAFIVASILADRLLGDPWTSAQITAAMTYTVDYYNAFLGHNATPAPHAWSLGVEEQFYLLWPLALLLLLRYGRTAAAIAMASCIAIAPVWRTLLYIGWSVDAHYIYNAFDTRFDALAVGCLIALLSNRTPFLGAAKALATRAWYPLVTIGSLTLSNFWATPNYSYTIRFSIDSALLGVLLLQVLQLHSRRSWRWLDARPVDYLGTISYPMYLWHAWGTSIALNVPSAPRLAKLALAIVATTLLGAVSYHMLEKPILASRPRIEGWLFQIVPHRARVRVSR